MLRKFLPNDHVETVVDITPESLLEKGIKGVITDLDNTLVAWDQPDATPEIANWFKDLKRAGIKVTIMSNNSEDRVSAFSEPLDISFIPKARKPLGNAFRKAKRQMDLNNDEIVVVGDQLLTDVLGGNRAKFHTILVVPVVETDGFFTRFNRRVERRIMEHFRKKGQLYWED
ncbi:YqeG family HAD IIIA-type phosphatase [Alkalibacillus aidingensis]|uniref:YqeG family HAD IIIA-type phosphatase n=1 Tax=Alkalibacillus aidingensis TaxID=2747607 RepID=UPI001660C37F|nr:YqeG family HAD IIIA-type phosphatase [Alkalibacillus aidingensis]